MPSRGLWLPQYSEIFLHTIAAGKKIPNQLSNGAIGHGLKRAAAMVIGGHMAHVHNHDSGEDCDESCALAHSPVELIEHALKYAPVIAATRLVAAYVGNTNGNTHARMSYA